MREGGRAVGTVPNEMSSLPSPSSLDDCEFWLS